MGAVKVRGRRHGFVGRGKFENLYSAATPITFPAFPQLLLTSLHVSCELRWRGKPADAEDFTMGNLVSAWVSNFRDNFIIMLTADILGHPDLDFKAVC